MSTTPEQPDDTAPDPLEALFLRGDGARGSKSAIAAFLSFLDRDGRRGRAEAESGDQEDAEFASVPPPPAQDERLSRAFLAYHADQDPGLVPGAIVQQRPGLELLQGIGRDPTKVRLMLWKVLDPADPCDAKILERYRKKSLFPVDCIVAAYVSERISFFVHERRRLERVAARRS